MNLVNRVKSRNEQKNPTAAMGISLIVMYAVSGVLLLLLAVLLYHFDLSEESVRIGVIAVYVISGFAGGFLIGKQMQDKKYLWGLLTGVSYFVLLLLFSLLSKTLSGEQVSFEAVRILTTLALCAVSGMAGGMVS